jgi:DNA-binding NarL/FixJ family response regulator
VDDHSLMTFALRNFIESNDRFEIVGESSDGEKAVEMLQELSPDLMIMDIRMPKLSGFDATKAIKEKNAGVKIIIMSSLDDEESLFQADRVGADGYLFKHCDRQELHEAIDHVMSGGKYYSKDISAEILDKIIRKKYSNIDLVNTITKREIEIIKAISEGWNNKEISDKLFISDRTVNTHRTNIMIKLDAKNSVDLVVKALQKKII